MWKKYWKFNDWVAKKVLGEEVDSLKEFEEVPKRWKRLRKEPFKYIKTTGKEIFQYLGAKLLDKHVLNK